MTEYKVELRGISKTYPGSDKKANSGISLGLGKGEILCIAGENGAGKTTLMKILSGMEAPSAGEIFIDGNAVTIGSPLNAQRMGIGMVHQHFMLFPEYTVAENIVMGMEPRKRGIFFDGDAARAIAARLIDAHHFSIDPGATVRSLSIGEMQQVEVCRLLHRNADIIILDEPSSVLTEHETAALFSTLQTLASAGKSMFLITHKLHEIKHISDRVAVLRHGELVGICNTKDTSEYEISNLMLGNVTLPITVDPLLPEDARRGGQRGDGKKFLGLPAGGDDGETLKTWRTENAARQEEHDTHDSFRNHSVFHRLQKDGQRLRRRHPPDFCHPRAAPPAGHLQESPGSAVIAFNNVTVLKHGQKQPLLDNISFGVRGGEILGFAGVGGNGLGVIEAVLGGFLHPSAGTITHNGRDISRLNIRRLRGQGLAYVPADRQRVGSALGATVDENIIVDRRREFSRMGFLDRGAMGKFSASLMQRYNIAAQGGTYAAALSGGNLQKLILARETEQFRDYFVFSEPTWGLDIAASSFVQGEIAALREKGAAIILISTNLDEVLALAGRIIVMYRGRAFAEFSNGPADCAASIKEKIGNCMQGLVPSAALQATAGTVQP
ncbi:MAG: ATP-binding cassette domain-containing protein [Treponema sp.]|nr:ATP-binding cassette domain-containing protein [Treponema sp.]